ncbi:hypothetical protein HDU80_003287 [Chytriomyces hyalinus]|nr:hypothetical protein HDU80_003287 [Chytriomyces hyalinus]
MTPCSSNCACCQRHAEHVHSLQQRALDELNFYRKLLQLDLLTTMEAFASSAEDADTQPAARTGSVTRPAALGTMPTEILDQIVQFVDGESILPLCHALPYFKYISTAMFEFAHRFSFEHYTLSRLWPDMHLPKYQTRESRAANCFPVKHLHAAGVYSRIVSKNGGNVHVSCSENVFNYLGALSDEVSLCPGDEYLAAEWTKLLRWLADGNKRIRSCTVDADTGYGPYSDFAEQLPRLQIQSLVWRDERFPPIEILDALPRIKGLSYFETDIPEDGNDFVSRCLDLTEIAFTKLLSLQDTASQVRCILRLINGSRIQKVWCKKVPLASHGRHLEAASSEFLKRGWHEKTNDDDDRICFVYRRS